jgi:hypothetical protein
MSYSRLASISFLGAVTLYLELFGAGVVCVGRAVPLAGGPPFDGETPETEADAGVFPGCAGCALSCFKNRDPANETRESHSTLIPSENLDTPCSKRTTNAKVKAASRASRKTPESKLLMAGSWQLFQNHVAMMNRKGWFEYRSFVRRIGEDCCPANPSRVQNR